MAINLAHDVVQRDIITGLYVVCGAYIHDFIQGGNIIYIYIYIHIYIYIYIYYIYIYNHIV